MKLIVLTGEAKVGKTHALELLKKANDGTIKYFEDDISYSDISQLLKRKEKLGVVVARFSEGRDTVDTREFSFKNVFVISSNNNFMSGKKAFYVNRFIDGESKLDWTEGFHWLKSISITKEKPKIVDEFFNYICK